MRPRPQISQAQDVTSEAIRDPVIDQLRTPPNFALVDIVLTTRLLATT
jgi:hypothetical protein